MPAFTWAEWQSHVSDPAMRRQLDEVLRERRQAKRYKRLANAVSYDGAKPGTAWHRHCERLKSRFNADARHHANRAKRLRVAIGYQPPKVKAVRLPSVKDQRIARQYNPEATDCLPCVRKWLADDASRSELRRLLRGRTSDTIMGESLPAEGDYPREYVRIVVPAWADSNKRAFIRRALADYREAVAAAEVTPNNQPEPLAVAA